MGMDGISMIGTGIVQEGTSKDIATQTAQNVQQGNNAVKNVNQLTEGNIVKEKEGQEKRQGAEENSKSEEDESNTEEENTENENDDDEDESNLKEYDQSDYENFYVKIVPESDTVELYDKITDALIETISAKDLTQLVEKLNIASGIFVNKRV